MKILSEVIIALVEEVKELVRQYEIYFFMRKYTIIANRRGGSIQNEKN